MEFFSLLLGESDFTGIKSRKAASWQMRGSRDCLEYVLWTSLSHLSTVTLGQGCDITQANQRLVQQQPCTTADRRLQAPGLTSWFRRWITSKHSRNFPAPGLSGEGSSKEHRAFPVWEGKGVTYSPCCVYIITPLILSIIRIILKIYANSAGECY